MQKREGDQKGELLLIVGIIQQFRFLGIGEKSAFHQHRRAVQMMKQIDVASRRLDLPLVLGLKVFRYRGLDQPRHVGGAFMIGRIPDLQAVIL